MEIILKKRLTLITIAFSVLLAGLLVIAAPENTYAAAKQDVCESVGGTWDTATATCDEQGGVTLNGVVTAVVNILSAIVGITAVIMMIVGGLKYVTSAGDSNKTASAKNTIVYAVVGIIIAVLAQIIVRFVIGKATGADTGPPPTP